MDPIKIELTSTVNFETMKLGNKMRFFFFFKFFVHIYLARDVRHYRLQICTRRRRCRSRGRAEESTSTRTHAWRRASSSSGSCAATPASAAAMVTIISAVYIFLSNHSRTFMNKHVEPSHIRPLIVLETVDYGCED